MSEVKVKINNFHPFFISQNASYWLGNPCFKIIHLFYTHKYLPIFLTTYM